MKAAEKGYLNVAKLLIEHKANIEIHSNDGCCALIRASNYGHMEIVRLFVDNGADINVRSKSGNTALIKGWKHIPYFIIIDIIHYPKFLTDVDFSDGERLRKSC
jgi:hypothetical protein